MLTGINTYGLTKELGKDFDGTLKRVKKAGADSLEVCILCKKTSALVQKFTKNFTGGVFPVEQAQEKINRVRKYGLKVFGAHIMLADFSEEGVRQTVSELLEIARKCGLDYYVLSIAKSKTEDVRSMIGPLNYAAGAFQEAGVSFLFHNHDAELADDNGDTVFDYLLRNVPQMGLQLDVGWVAYPGKNPLEYMEKYADRIRIIHFKDITRDACEKNRRDCYTAIGEGVIPLSGIIEASAKLSLHEQGFVIDQDRSSTDMLSDVAVSLKNIRAGKCVTRNRVIKNNPFQLSVWSMMCALGKRPESFRNLLQACSRSGVGCVDVMGAEVRLYGMENVEHFLAAANMKVNCYIITLPMKVCNPARIKKALDRELERAARLGADKLMIVPHGVKCSADENERKAVADEIAKCFNIAVERAKIYDIKVCVEDTPDFRIPLSTAAECRYVLEKAPGLGLVYDTANMLPGGDTPEAFYEELKDYICHVHLKDVIYTERGKGEPCADGRDILCVPAGKGVIPLRDIIERLTADGYHGSAMLEYARPKAHTYAAHRKNVMAYLRALFASKEDFKEELKEEFKEDFKEELIEDEG